MSRCGAFPQSFLSGYLYLERLLLRIVLGIGSFAVNWPIVGSVFLFSAFWFTFVVWLVRRHRIAWMHCDDELHQLTHHLRDHLDGIQRCENPNALTLKVENCESAFADAVANYFAKRLHNDSCGCCIRLAAISDGLPGYVTRARSRSLGVGRRERSEPIFEDSSFVRMLKDKDSLGVWLLNDLKLASESKLWPDLKNNELMHFDSVMIAPVNTVIDNKKSMTGILFVTAKGRVFFSPHTLLP